MILGAYTFLHVIISLVAIGSGLVVVYGMITSKWFEGLTSVFLATTVATSVTGFFFPYHGLTPGYVLGVLSLIALAFAYAGRRHFRQDGGWRKTYIITSLLSLYFNVFVLITQMFRKIPALKELAPTQSEPPFQMTQLVVLVLFILVGIRATMRFGKALRTA